MSASAWRRRGGLLGCVHSDVARARGELQATQILLAADFHSLAAATGRLSRADPDRVAGTRMTPEFMADAPSHWDAATGRSATIDRVCVAVPRLSPSAEAKAFADRGISDQAPIVPARAHCPRNAPHSTRGVVQLRTKGARLAHGRGLACVAGGQARASQSHAS